MIQTLEYSKDQMVDFINSVEDLASFESLGLSSLFTENFKSYSSGNTLKKIDEFKFDDYISKLYGSNKVKIALKKYSTENPNFSSSLSTLNYATSIAEQYFFIKSLLGTSYSVKFINDEMLKNILMTTPNSVNLISNFFNLFYYKVRETKQAFEIFKCIDSSVFFENLLNRYNQFNMPIGYSFSKANILKDLKVNAEYEKVFNNYKKDFLEAQDFFEIFTIISELDFKAMKADGVSYATQADGVTLKSGVISRLEQLDRLGITYNVVQFESLQKLNFLFDWNSDQALTNPATKMLNEVYTRYYALANDLTQNSPKCELLKTILYAGTFLLREPNKKSNNSEASVFNKMNEITSAPVNWATGTHKTNEPSFYGDSEFAKMFYSYYAYMVQDYNPFSDVMDNATCNKMDMDAMDIHSMLASDELQKIVYDLIYNKDLVGDKSLYEMVHMTRDILKLLGEPIVVSNSISEMINYVSGILSSIINNLINELDFAISDIMAELFYSDVFPWFDGKKISLAGIYNSIAFLIVILEQCNTTDRKIDSISETEFVNKAMSILGIEEDGLSRCGFFAFTGMLNDKDSSSFLSYMNKDGLFKDYKDDVYTCKRNEKVAYSIIKFAEAKHNFLNTNEFSSDEKDYSNKSYITKLANSLTKEEYYYIFDLYGVNRIALEDHFTSYTSKELYDFNFDIIKTDIMARFNHDSPSFYKAFNDANKNSIRMEMKETNYNHKLYKQWIEISLEEYLDAKDYNETMFEDNYLDSIRLGDLDDFLMRFLPSIVTLGRVFNKNMSSLTTVIDFLKSVNHFITQDLFLNLFIGVKDKLIRIARAYTENMFATLNSLSSQFPNKTLIDLNLDTSDAVNELDRMLKVMEDITQLTNMISNCYKDGNNNIYSRNAERKNNITLINSDYLDENPAYFTKVNEDNNLDYETIYYENGKIIGVKPGGKEIIIVGAEDEYNSNTGIIIRNKDLGLDNNISSETNGNSNISDPNYNTLIKIRDSISNAGNIEIISIMNEIKQQEQSLSNEYSKAKPDISKTKEIKIEINKLTKDLNDAKNKYNMITSNESINQIEPTILKIELFNFINGNYTFEERAKAIQELNETAINSGIPLTNSDIFYLLQ